MKHSTSRYAAALTAALAEKRNERQRDIIRRFLALLLKNKDVRRLGPILRAFERRWLRTQNRHKVAVASVVPLARNVREEILRLTGRSALVTESIDPGLYAGIRIIVDDELLIDASARRRIGRMFAK